MVTRDRFPSALKFEWAFRYRWEPMKMEPESTLPSSAVTPAAFGSSCLSTQQMARPSESQNFLYVHLNRVIKKYDLDMFYIAGPGHGGPALVGNTYLEGTYSEIYPDISQDEAGLKKLFMQFSFPGGISSHVAPTTPGSIHEGGELGHSLSHAFGAAFDNPGLIGACVIGDGEAETGPLATAWQSNKLLNPISDGVVLPILHLNGYKISNPTVLWNVDKGLSAGGGEPTTFASGEPAAPPGGRTSGRSRRATPIRLSAIP
jgi:hypothetical protein